MRGTDPSACCCEMRGTDMLYGVTLAYGAMHCPTKHMFLPVSAMCGTDLAYGAAQSQTGTGRLGRKRCPISLRACYTMSVDAMCGTNLAYGATGLRFLPGTMTAYGATTFCCTETPYGATRTWR
eukprot:3221838-Rhodomonas_salina.3